jgi:hypothetical protein
LAAQALVIMLVVVTFVTVDRRARSSAGVGSPRAST